MDDIILTYLATPLTGGTHIAVVITLHLCILPLVLDAVILPHNSFRITRHKPVLDDAGEVVREHGDFLFVVGLVVAPLITLGISLIAPP
jgi:hypothetical protein